MFLSLFVCVCSDNETLQDVLRAHRIKYLPVSRDEYQRMVVRRNHVWDDALCRFKAGISVKKYIKVTFVGEPAVDQGGPLREFFHLLLCDIAQNNSLLCGCETSRVPAHNMLELAKQSYYYIGVMIATSIIHGGPAPNFFADVVADYIVYGMSGVKATAADIPSFAVQMMVLKVIFTMYLVM